MKPLFTCLPNSFNKLIELLKQTGKQKYVTWKWFSAVGLNFSCWLHSKSNCCFLITGEFCPYCQRPDSTHPETAATSQERMQLLVKELQASLNTTNHFTGNLSGPGQTELHQM